MGVSTWEAVGGLAGLLVCFQGGLFDAFSHLHHLYPISLPDFPPPLVDAITLSKKLSSFSLSVLYGEMPDIIYQTENLVCPVDYVDDPASLQDFVIRYKAVGKSKEGQPACQIDTGLVRVDFVPLEDAPFLAYLESSIARTLKKPVLGDYEEQICGLQQVESGIACPNVKAQDCEF